MSFSDGTIDNYALDSPATLAQAGQATFVGTQASLDWTIGQGLLSQQFGQTTTLLKSEPYVDTAFAWLAFDGTCTVGQYHLSNIGTVTATEAKSREGSCAHDDPQPKRYQFNFLTQVRKLVSNLGERSYAITLDGGVYG